MEFDKFVIVKKKTMLEELLQRHSTTSQAKFYLESSGQSYDYYESSHKSDKEGLKFVLDNLPGKIRTQVVDKVSLETFCFGERDLIIAVGGDGMLVNLAKYTGKQPVISVNPDENLHDGVLASCNIQGFRKLLDKTLKGDFETEKLTMAEAKLDNGQVMYALNDFYIGKSNHSSARYTISFGEKKERQSSDGLIVSTGTGSTGWLKAIATGFEKVCGNFPLKVPFSRESERLTFVVRNPFPSKVTFANVVYGEITENSSLTIGSEMTEKGVIFSDGIDSDFLEFNSGRTAFIKPADKKVYLVRRE